LGIFGHNHRSADIGGLFFMPRFNPGDRVQLTGDISRFYNCVIGVVLDCGVSSSSVLKTYLVRLADKTVGIFFDFQLHTPPLVPAQVVFDSRKPNKQSPTRGTVDARHIVAAAGEVEVHVRIAGTWVWSIIGQASVSRIATNAIGTLLVDQRIMVSEPANEEGEFRFTDVPASPITLEVFVPDQRIVAALAL
jgi:hypothetical protein